MANQPKIVGGTAQQRRSSRVTIAIPVVVYGKGPDQNIFVEEVTTSVVNAHGGMFTLRTAVGRLDTVVLKNPRTGVKRSVGWSTSRIPWPASAKPALNSSIPPHDSGGSLSHPRIGTGPVASSQQIRTAARTRPSAISSIERDWLTPMRVLTTP